MLTAATDVVENLYMLLPVRIVIYDRSPLITLRPLCASLVGYCTSHLVPAAISFTTPPTRTTTTTMKVLSATLCTAFLAAEVLATPAVENELQGRAAAVDNIVYVTDAENFW